nr:MAG TPA: hypothetical protein [Caudoviricetes sp.]
MRRISPEYACRGGCVQTGYMLPRSCRRRGRHQ